MAAGDDDEIRPFQDDTALIIGLGDRRPVHRFQFAAIVCGLIDLNVMQAAYGHAIARKFRLYRHGDSRLLRPTQK